MKRKLILAPMVRAGTLPLRLMSLKYGAAQVYSPELVDKLLITTKRTPNPLLNTIDFLTSDSKLALRISPLESSRLAVQLGTSCPDFALAAARIVEKDCAQIDINCGCPKRFSLQGGMGAALLLTPDLLVSILKNLVTNLSIPVSCKIRLLTDPDGKVDLEKTIELMQRLVNTGICAIGVHCRMVDERPRERAHWDVISEILKRVTKCPVIVNGDIYTAQDMTRLEELGVEGFMVARGAQFNPSVFASLIGPDGHDGLSMLSGMEAAKEYLKTALDYDMPMHNLKWTILQMVAQILPKPPLMKVVRRVMPKKRKLGGVGKDVEMELSINCLVSQAKSKEEMAGVFGMEEFYRGVRERLDGMGDESGDLELCGHH